MQNHKTKDKILYTVVTVTDMSLNIHPSVMKSLAEARSIARYILYQNKSKEVDCFGTFFVHFVELNF